MDFKVAGTSEFVTAIQLDTKLDGIPASVLAAALTQARDARLHILDVMAEAIDRPGRDVAVRPAGHHACKVPVDKIGEVIGPKGKMINQIQDDTGADISIEDDGTVYIGATDGPSAEAARAAINAIANPTMPEVGERYMGTVVKTTTFGAFVSLVPGKDGLLHISQIRKMVGGKRVENVEDVLSVGQKVQVEISEIDPRGKLSLVPVLPDAEGDGRRSRRQRRAPSSSRPGRTPDVREADPAAADVPAGRPEQTVTGEVGGAVVRRAVLPGGVRVLTEAMPGLRSATIGVLGRRRLARRGPTATTAPRTSSSTCCSRAPRGARRWTSPRRSTPSAVRPTPSPARSTPATTRGCWTTTSRWRPTSCCDMVTARPAGRRGRRERARGHPRRARDERRRPGDVVHERFAELVLGDHPLGRPIGGTPHTIEAVGRDDIAAHYREHYDAARPGRDRGGRRRPRRARARRSPSSWPRSGWRLTDGAAPRPRRAGAGRGAGRRTLPAPAGCSSSGGRPSRPTSSSARSGSPRPTSAAT